MTKRTSARLPNLRAQKTAAGNSRHPIRHPTQGERTRYFKGTESGRLAELVVRHTPQDRSTSASRESEYIGSRERATGFSAGGRSVINRRTVASAAAAAALALAAASWPPALATEPLAPGGVSAGGPAVVVASTKPTVAPLK